MHVFPRRKTVTTEQALTGQHKGSGEGSWAVMDHTGTAEAEGLQGAAAEPRRPSQPKRGQAG